MSSLAFQCDVPSNIDNKFINIYFLFYLAKIREKTKMAYYVHCPCDRLNLVIYDVVNLIMFVANMISLIKTTPFLGTKTVHA